MRMHRWLALVPFAFTLGGVLVANRVRPFVFGLPFFLAWTIAGVALSAIVMACVYRLDPDNRSDEP
nr:DUF3311 domain-containing protein [Pelomonas sp. KK5]